MSAASDPDNSSHGSFVVTPSALSEYTYCSQKWALAQKYGKISRDELVRRVSALAEDGKKGSSEHLLYTRMITATDRMDAGTAAHTVHGQQVDTTQKSFSASWYLLAAGIVLALISIYMIFSK